VRERWRYFKLSLCAELNLDVDPVASTSQDYKVEGFV
jgi:hypothetical protein